MVNNNYKEFIKDSLEGLSRREVGSPTFRKMFGGWGIFAGKLMFGLIADETLYFKVDAVNKTDFEKQGSVPFSYVSNNKEIIIQSYWRVPLDLLDDTDELCIWAAKSYQAARRLALHKKRRNK